ncbi:atrial natriuretic peptide receptor 1-like [Babylonia areolata]|uniref:atrial natriuretic peptide receptor 1-like n=1 Tax=Babylonia areolata TaxID=304850 RepID=UPI003FD2A4AE
MGVTFRCETECGDGQCDGEEDCHSCDSDCGQCAVTLHTKWIIVIAVLCICGILLIITLVTLLFFRWKRNRALNDETWVVEPSQILAAASSMHLSEKLSVISWQSAQSKIKALSDPAMQEITREHAICSLSVAHVKGQKVLVKTYHNEEFQLTPRIRKEVMTVRHLVHPNLCPFIGGTVQPGNIFILYEYCSKGSLIDLLSNEDLPLNWIFRFSMLADVSRGMAFLHRHNLVHGNLKSSNCVVDDRWVCKVTDYGLQEYRRESFTCSDEEELRIRHEEKVRRDRVYRAPEADTDLQPASDVFSFAVIMLEVATRERVKPQGGQSHEELKRSGRRFSLHIDMHSDSTTFEPHRTSSFRSSQSRVTTASRYQELIVKCWADKPGDRPDFLTIEKVLLLMTPSKKNPVDTMMGLMQMYSKNLQQLVEKRSQQLLEEKQKTESLLYNILPRPVADKLRNGQPVRAESYEASTVFFSDIMGFNTMSARSSPMQIVVLLNKLYTNFDSVIERYNVYKVETIGDAYMVVSGVPNRNTQHAYDVAMMALDMMTTTKNFVIPHLPTEPLFIRAGLHSGPVCAGVVGIKMPRYCLFGDTVNTASRMESNARASSIHISNATYEALEPTNKFQFECRGHILIKGDYL